MTGVIPVIWTILGSIQTILVSDFQLPKNRPMAGTPHEESAARFRTTHWSVVMAARNGEDQQSRLALEELCRTYWPPIYAYLRRSGHAKQDAQDLTQGFFAHFLDHGFLQRLLHREGRFRSFLLTFLKRFLSDERDKARAEKRGGGKVIVSLEDCTLQEQQLSPLAQLTASEAFDRSWAMTLLGRAHERLREEYQAAGKAALYETLRPWLHGESTTLSYAQLAERLSAPENSAKSLVHRLRRRYGEMIREEVGRTVEATPLIDEEIRHLLALVGE